MCIQGQTITIKVKTIDFEVKSHGMTLSKPVSKCTDLYQNASELLKQEIKASGSTPLRLRLMGMYVYGRVDYPTHTSFLLYRN